MTEATVLFIQGGGAGAYEEDHRLVEDLSSRLERGNIIYPKMPDEDNPDYDSWKSAIAEELTGISGGVLLVAHSVGAFIVLKYLLENEPNQHITGLFFIATPFVGAGGWELDMALDAAAYKRPLPAPVFFYHGTADEIVPFEHLALYEAAIPQAVFRKIDGRGHQLDNNLAEVAGDINIIFEKNDKR